MTRLAKQKVLTVLLMEVFWGASIYKDSIF